VSPRADVVVATAHPVRVITTSRTGAPVSVEYAPPFEFTGGRIVRVEMSLGDDQYLDLESEAAAMMAREQRPPAHHALVA
jgi:hypothetical protein